MPPVTEHSEHARHRSKWSRRLLWIGTAAVLVALTAAVFGSTDGGDAVGPKQDRLVPVVKILAPIEIVTVAPADVSESLALSGDVTPVLRTTVSAEVAGLVGQVTRRPGESVTAGEVLATIAPDDHHLALQVREAELAGLAARLRAAEATLDRTSRLTERGASSSAALEDAQRAVEELVASVAAAGAAVRQAEVNLERATVRAPITGIVADRSVEPGHFVQPGTALLEVIDLSTVLVEAMVPLSRAARLRPGQPALFWSPDHADVRIEGRVSRIAPRAVPGTRSVKVYLEISNAGLGLRAGAFLMGKVETRRAAEVLAVPSGAIRNDSGQPRVLAIRDGRAVLVPVVTGPVWNSAGLVEITSGLQAGDVVVTLPLAGLEPGDRVALTGG